MPYLAVFIAFFLFSLPTNAQDTMYGENDKAGKYVDAGDAKVYYETYGSGEPLLLLHGGVYGYMYNLLPDAQLLILPNSTHVSLLYYKPMISNNVLRHF